MNKLRSTPNTPSVGLKLDLPPVTEAVKLLKKVFDIPVNRYETYDHLVQNDPELAGAIDTKATFVAKILGGFTVFTGTERTEAEEKLQSELDKFHLFMRKYNYDIAYKVLKDGDACYLIQKDSKGVTSLDYLPQHALTCVEKELAETQVTKRGVYYLSEGTDLAKPFPTSSVIHFDLGRKERVIDIKSRVTTNVWNQSPLESLRAKLLWKVAIIINDMIWRERHVPREHHKLPAAQFNPDLFPGRTPKERSDAAIAAAKNAIKAYKESLASKSDELYPKPDQGYITLDNVKIDTVEPKLSHSDPNELIDQIDKSVYSIYSPESTVSGRGRGTYGTEAAVMMYTALKGERVAEAIAYTEIELAKIHLRTNTENTFSEEDYKKIVPRFNRILERHALVRDAAILLESGAFTPTEVRRLTGSEPLSDMDKKEIEEYRAFLGTTRRRHIESITEIATTSKRAGETERPITPHSEEQQQVT